MSPETGRRFGPYEIQSRLGGGGMGHVYRAWDARLHREVAIKLLNNEYAMPGMRERFLREARAASALNHPNICTIFDIGEQDGEPYLVMELLQGETLKDRIHRQSISVDELICIARETAEALGAAHLKGIVHRDIKPANIFLVEKPNGGIQAKVLDFGLAKIDGGVLGPRGRALELTTVGATVGTLAYMSPEQARGEVLDSRSDLFSLGVVMYEMATRHVPFQGATSALIFVQLLNHAPEPVREWNESVPKELERIIFRLLTKERTGRFQTAREVELSLIALGDKGGGWLRKAVTAVPLVRAADPVAREKRISRPRSGPSSEVTPSRITPPRNDSGAGRSGSIREPAQRPSADDQFLRPVVRAPRSGSNPPVARPNSVSREANSFKVPVSDPGSFRPSRGAANQAPSSEVISSIAGQAIASKDPRVSSAPKRKSATPQEKDSSPLDPDNEVEVRKRLWTLLAIVAGFIAMGAVLWFVLHGSYRTATLHHNNTLVVTDIENRTTDKTLDGAVAQGLELDLAQSPFLRLRDSGQWHLAYQQLLDDPHRNPDADKLATVRRAADRLGLETFLVGTISGTSAPYLIHVDLEDVRSGIVLASSESRAPSLLQIPAAIDVLAGDLRVAVGESGASIDQTSTPLSRDATGNLEALQRFSQGRLLAAAGQSSKALKLFQQAASLDPRFVQALLQRSEILAQLHAEPAAGESARQALAGADTASERTRTLAQVAYEIQESGDLVRATSMLRKLLNTYPHDPVALANLSLTLRLQGHFTEALQAGQQAYGEDAGNNAGYMQVADALVDLDRYDPALDLITQGQRSGPRSAGTALAAVYFAGNHPPTSLFGSTMSSIADSAGTAVYLDNTGRLSEGAALWRTRASAMLNDENLRSSAPYYLAQGAINRALLDDCPDALTLAHEADGQKGGRGALFNLGITFGLCGETSRAQQTMDALQQRFPQSFEVTSFYLADIKGAIALHDRDADAALDALRSARAFDLISITPFLRGLAHVQLRRSEVAIVDLQTVLSHKGISLLSGSTIYPAAQIEVARAFAQSGDVGNSSDAYGRFLALWHDADARNPIVLEARRGPKA